MEISKELQLFDRNQKTKFERNVELSDPAVVICQSKSLR